MNRDELWRRIEVKKLIRLTDYSANEIYDIFKIADEVQQGKYNDILKGKSVVLFFPNSSIRTRVTFEKGIYLLGGQPILFPTETLDKKEDLKDVCGYLNMRLVFARAVELVIILRNVLCRMMLIR